MRIFLTGASGFLGSHLSQYLHQKGHEIICLPRTLPGTLPQKIDAVIHLAAIAHGQATAEEYNLVNVRMAIDLAEKSKKAGVGQFIFISSITAQTGSYCNDVITELSNPDPQTPYGKSKLEAEQNLKKLDLPLTILRPVVVYGPGAKGNFASLRKLAKLPLPLPFGSLTAKRSILSIQNFNRSVETILNNQRAIGETFIVSDLQPRTIPEIVSDIRLSIGMAPKIVSVPGGLIRLPLKAAGIWEKTGLPLVVSSEKLLALGWQPTDERISV